jgi:flagellar hook assembly protein FlgD
LQKIALALVFALLATVGIAAPGPRVATTAAATPPPKVVLIVGATHGQTETYRQRADVAYAEAIKYTPNVVKVYSPNATWANVKAALQGASVVMYMGHGNGFPSPYRTTPWAYSQNGFGLNQVAGQGDYNNQYYGEHYLATEVKLAPNAVVLLNHLCYAAGNSEPGHAEPTVDVAKQRADNYAAGFLAAGARAVIADGLMGPAYYIRSLFTTHQTVDQMWRAAPNFNGNEFSFTSVRSPAFRVQMDPKTPTSGFYRAITGNLTLKTDDVVGAPAAPTPGDPTSFTVPGNASVAVDQAGVYSDEALTRDPVTGAAPATLPFGAKVRVLAVAPSDPAVFQIASFDGSAAGYTAVADLAPGDSTAPQVLNASGGTGLLSPNGDGRSDTVTVSAQLSETAWWRVRFWNGTQVLASKSATGTSVSAAWNGILDGAPVADGTYRWTIEAKDSWQNIGARKSGNVVVDTVAPSLGQLSLASTSPVPTFSPNGDGRSDTVSIGWQVNEAGTVEMTVRNAAGTTVASKSTAAAAGAGSTTWDGRSTSGATVPDGLYTVRLTPRDRAGNGGVTHERKVAVYGALSAVSTSVGQFYPQDGDRFAATTDLSFSLARTATVTWRITNRDGTPVLTRYERTSLPAGKYTFRWDGKTAAGQPVPPGMYTSSVYATNGQQSITQKTWVVVDAFNVKSSDTTPVRGQSVTITAVSAEPLSGAPVLHVTEPGQATWGIRMVKGSGSTWTTTVMLEASAAGTGTFRVSALDADGAWQRSYLYLPIE